MVLPRLKTNHTADLAENQSWLSSRTIVPRRLHGMKAGASGLDELVAMWRSVEIEIETRFDLNRR